MMKKWINLIREFTADDFSGEGGGDDGREMVEVEGICWYDAEGEEVYADDLPTETTLAIDENRNSSELWVRNAIEHELEKKYGVKHGAEPQFFNYRFI